MDLDASYRAIKEGKLKPNELKILLQIVDAQLAQYDQGMKILDEFSDEKWNYESYVLAMKVVNPEAELGSREGWDKMGSLGQSSVRADMLRFIREGQKNFTELKDAIEEALLTPKGINPSVDQTPPPLVTPPPFPQTSDSRSGPFGKLADSGFMTSICRSEFWLEVIINVVFGFLLGALLKLIVINDPSPFSPILLMLFMTLLCFMALPHLYLWLKKETRLIFILAFNIPGVIFLLLRDVLYMVFISKLYTGKKPLRYTLLKGGKEIPGQDWNTAKTARISLARYGILSVSIAVIISIISGVISDRGTSSNEELINSPTNGYVPTLAQATSAFGTGQGIDQPEPGSKEMPEGFLAVLPLDGALINQAVWSPDGTKIALLQDGKLKIFDYSNSFKIISQYESLFEFIQVLWSPDSQRLLLVSLSSPNYTVIDLSGNQLITFGDNVYMYQQVFWPGGDEVYQYGTDGWKAFSTSTGAESNAPGGNLPLEEIENSCSRRFSYDLGYFAAIHSKNINNLASSYAEEGLYVFDVQNGKLKFHSKKITCHPEYPIIGIVFWSDEPSHLIANDQYVDLAKRKSSPIKVNMENGEFIFSYSFSPDGTELAYITGTQSQEKLWISKNKKNSDFEITNGTNIPILVDWSPDGQKLAVIFDYGLTGGYQLVILDPEQLGK